MPCFLYIFEFDHKNVKIDIDLELHITYYLLYNIKLFAIHSKNMGI